MSGIVSRRANNVHRNITVTPFLNKLYSMVDDSASDDLIRWTADGNSFVVLRHEDFAKEVLPRFFKHSNFSSFVRQLNMYGFHKVPHLQQGGLIADGPEAESSEFNNENFQRGQPDLLHFIRRKKGSRDSVSAGQDNAPDAEAGDDDVQPESDDDGVRHGPTATATTTSTAAAAIEAPAESVAQATKNRAAATAGKGAEPNGAKARASRTPPVNLAKILKEIQVIRDHQLTISTDIKQLQEENQSLWMQASATEKRYNEHQETIDKIVGFLATVFSTDSRRSEILPPLHRLISHNAKGAQNRSGNAAHAAASTINSSARPGRSSWTQDVFEEMDFPDVLASNQPPTKKRHTGKSSQSENIYEIPSNASSPAEPVIQKPASSQRSPVGQTSGRTVRRKTNSPTQSTALTRTQPRPAFNVPLPPQYAPTASDNADGSNALMASPGSPYSNLKSHTKSIEQLQQEINTLGVSVDNLKNLMRQMQTGMLSQVLSMPSLSAGGYPAAPAAVAAAASSGGGLQSSLAGPANSLQYTMSGSGKDDYSALLTSEALESLTASLASSGPEAGSGVPNDPIAAPIFNDPGNMLQSALATNSATSAGINANIAAATNGDTFNPSALSELLQSYTPEQFNTLQSYLGLINNPNMHLLTDGTHGADKSSFAASGTPFLDFVDPDASGHSAPIQDTDAETGADAADAVSNVNDYTQILLDALSSTQPQSTSVTTSAPSASEDLAASFLRAVSSTTAGDGLTTRADSSMADSEQQG
ncbi:Heat shock transcription factor [Coemansia sp. RSA 2611]|nr:Heat shock transcription factor [Coemansia sp. RSA 2610]KAJ2385952.1 Heat shock transcription factor [Coemansia sp. RSA 2611]